MEKIEVCWFFSSFLRYIASHEMHTANCAFRAYCIGIYEYRVFKSACRSFNRIQHRIIFFYRNRFTPIYLLY